jgi:hypothetical protein
MEIIHLKTNTKHKAIIELADDADYRKITKSRYWFDWKTEKGYSVYKLRLAGSNEILGLMSLIHYEEEKRFVINLLAVSKENRGKQKTYDHIAGNLIAFACAEMLKRYALDGCVSLVPKTELKTHYMKKYGMQDAGWQLFLEGRPLLNLLKTYNR